MRAISLSAVLATLLASFGDALHLQPLQSTCQSPCARGLSRRRALRTLLPLPVLLAAPGQTKATCVCRTLNECECTENNKQLYEKRRVDAAGRDLKQSLKELKELQGGDQPLPRKIVKPLQRSETTAPVYSAPPEFGMSSGSVRVDSLGLSGGGSMNGGEVDVAGAKARFKEIVRKTVQKREADFGFELDAADIKQIEDVLRPKYCGPAGLIGPC